MNCKIVIVVFPLTFQPPWDAWNTLMTSLIEIIKTMIDIKSVSLNLSKYLQILELPGKPGKREGAGGHLADAAASPNSNSHL